MPLSRSVSICITLRSSILFLYCLTNPTCVSRECHAGREHLPSPRVNQTQNHVSSGESSIRIRPSPTNPWPSKPISALCLRVAKSSSGSFLFATLRSKMNDIRALSGFRSAGANASANPRNLFRDIPQVTLLDTPTRTNRASRTVSGSAAKTSTRCGSSRRPRRWNVRSPRTLPSCRRANPSRNSVRGGAGSKPVSNVC